MINNFYVQVEEFIDELKNERNYKTFEQFTILASEISKYVQGKLIKHTSLNQNGSLSVHSVNVALLSLQIAKDAKLDICMESLALGCLLHDIGKIYIHDDILMKPGRLNQIERAIVNTHTSMGYTVAKNYICNEMILDIINNHHSIFNCRKDEMMIKENQGVYLCGVCDIVDAMLSFRTYKKPLPKRIVLNEIKSKGEESILKYVNSIIGNKIELENEYTANGLIAINV